LFSFPIFVWSILRIGKEKKTKEKDFESSGGEAD
jgi:hypothetical protein